jgi:predicted metal-dependent peptidase
MNAVKDWLNPSKLHVIYFDSEVCHYDSFGQEDQLHVEPHGGGGTAFSPVFRHMAKNGIEPVATVFLTDLCCSDFGPAPDHPVLWVSTHDGEAPFGEVVRMHL